MWKLKYATRIKKDLKNIHIDDLQKIKASIEKLKENPYYTSKHLSKHPLADYSLRS